MKGAGLAAFVLVLGACSDAAAPTSTVPAPAATPATTVSLTVGATAVPELAVPAYPPDEYEEDRLAMVARQIEDRGITDAAVLEAMRSVPRHLFVPAELVGQAYDDHPLPIGFGQTISQPYIVALMTEELGVASGDRVLEIGTGSGYQAAVLGQMGIDVVTIEIIPELALDAAVLLGELGYPNVDVIPADGYFGAEELAPFDAIIVTAAPDHVPQPLVQQLAPGGRMVIPIGPVGAVQTLWRFTVDATGELVAENLGGVRFVPFTRTSE